MTKEDKGLLIQEIQEMLQNSNVLYVADIEGLNASASSDFRRQAFKNNVKVKVVKNTLLQKAMENVEDKDYSELYDSLKGNTVIMISDKGNAPAKMIKDIRKKSEKPVIKGAWIEEAVFIGDKVDELASIKSKEELLGDVIGLLQSPIKNLLGQLQSGQNTIGGLLKAIENK